MDARRIPLLDLHELAGHLHAGRLTSTAATRACLDAIERHQPRLNCFIRVTGEQALAAAAAADRELANGTRRGPLHGVPLAHKDMFHRAGTVSTCGSKILADRPATVTATLNERLDAAGAVSLGGLNMAEFAAGPTGHNTHYGHCRNPWDTERISGGSSSGSGAAVAARLAFASIGSDTGGSIRLPAGMCGVVGLKPTYGLVSRFGIMPRCWSLDVAGPLARTARDCALLLQAVAGHDERDPTSAPFPVPDFLASLDGRVSGLRIGVPVDPAFAQVSPDVADRLAASREVLASLGAEVHELALPDTRLLYALTNVVNKAEAATVHAAWVRERRGDYTLSAVNRLEAGFGLLATHYLDAIRLQGRVLTDFVRSVFERVDVLHLPLLGMDPPPIDATEIRDTRDVPALMERVTRFTRWVNYLGLPAMSVPCGFSDARLPVAFQLIGRPFAERTLLRVADAYQRVTRWHEAIPPGIS